MTTKRNIVILGAAESGVGAALLAINKGYDVFVSDSNPIKPKYKNILIENNIKFEENKHSLDIILKADAVIKSPGIDDNSPIISQIKQNSIKIISDIEFGWRHCNSKIIAVTGSNGKTTTTLLINHILNKAGYKSTACGNVGVSFCKSILTDNSDIYVVEVSSFQLDYCYEFKPNTAIILNITPDHLDRYKSFDDYALSKFRIAQAQTNEDALIYCADDSVITKHLTTQTINSNLYPFSFNRLERDNCAYVENNQIVVKTSKNTFTMLIEKLALMGRHNVYNSMAAALAGSLELVKNSVLHESLSDFKNIEHRLEIVAKIRGVTYINDSKATNVNSTLYALETIKKPIIWFVGGLDKGNDYSPLIEVVKEKVKAIICIGKDNSKIIEAFKNVVFHIVEIKDMEKAVQYAYRIAQKNDNVLLAPACASFDFYENFEDRGKKFKQAVLNL